MRRLCGETEVISSYVAFVVAVSPFHAGYGDTKHPQKAQLLKTNATINSGAACRLYWCISVDLLEILFKML